ncbi:unnamed protein product [Symbiodinium natans]|uniref:Uncharacterized protein n=1 Tax=Symbiodinium natans TaxID=878477 RepID=A0A812LM69_9DINO|nr:unnamed protein product [Symbiodinium natans]
MHDESQGQAAERVPPGQPQAALYATMGFWDDSLAFLEDTIVACYNADQTSFAKCIRKEIAHAWDDSSYNVMVSTAETHFGISLAPADSEATFHWGSYTIHVWLLPGPVGILALRAMTPRCWAEVRARHLVLRQLEGRDAPETALPLPGCEVLELSSLLASEVGAWLGSLGAFGFELVCEPSTDGVKGERILVCVETAEEAESWRARLNREAARKGAGWLFRVDVRSNASVEKCWAVVEEETKQLHCFANPVDYASGKPPASSYQLLRQTLTFFDDAASLGTEVATAAARLKRQSILPAFVIRDQEQLDSTANWTAFGAATPATRRWLEKLHLGARQTLSGAGDLRKSYGGALDFEVQTDRSPHVVDGGVGTGSYTFADDSPEKALSPISPKSEAAAQAQHEPTPQQPTTPEHNSMKPTAETPRPTEPDPHQAQPQQQPPDDPSPADAREHPPGTWQSADTWQNTDSWQQQHWQPQGQTGWTYNAWYDWRPTADNPAERNENRPPQPSSAHHRSVPDSYYPPPYTSPQGSRQQPATQTATTEAATTATTNNQGTWQQPHPHPQAENQHGQPQGATPTQNSQQTHATADTLHQHQHDNTWWDEWQAWWRNSRNPENQTSTQSPNLHNMTPGQQVLYHIDQALAEANPSNGTDVAAHLHECKTILQAAGGNIAGSATAPTGPHGRTPTQPPPPPTQDHAGHPPQEYRAESPHRHHTPRAIELDEAARQLQQVLEGDPPTNTRQLTHTLATAVELIRRGIHRMGQVTRVDDWQTWGGGEVAAQAVIEAPRWSQPPTQATHPANVLALDKGGEESHADRPQQLPQPAHEERIVHARRLLAQLAPFLVQQEAIIAAQAMQALDDWLSSQWGEAVYLINTQAGDMTPNSLPTPDTIPWWEGGGGTGEEAEVVKTVWATGEITAWTVLGNLPPCAVRVCVGVLPAVIPTARMRMFSHRGMVIFASHFRNRQLEAADIRGHPRTSRGHSPGALRNSLLRKHVGEKSEAAKPSERAKTDAVKMGRQADESEVDRHARDVTPKTFKRVGDHSLNFARGAAGAPELAQRLQRLRSQAQDELAEAESSRRSQGVLEGRLRELEERWEQHEEEAHQLQSAQQELAHASEDARTMQQTLRQREREHRGLELEEHQLQAAAMRLEALRAALEGEEAQCRLTEAGCVEEHRVEERLHEDAALHEQALEQVRGEAHECAAKRCQLREKAPSQQKSYWEAAPFLTVEEDKLWRRRQELKSYHRQISALQEQHSRNEVHEHARRHAAESFAACEKQAQDSEKHQREQSLRELLSLQQHLSDEDVKSRHKEAKAHTESDPDSELDALQDTQQRLLEQVASLKTLAERLRPAVATDSFAATLSGASSRVISQMKEALVTDLGLTEKLQATKKEIEDRLDRERRLRAELERRLSEPAEVSATIAEFLRAEPRAPANSEVPERD